MQYFSIKFGKIVSGKLYNVAMENVGQNDHHVLAVVN
jgi:hypothetical protein